MLQGDPVIPRYAGHALVHEWCAWRMYQDSKGMETATEADP